MIKYIGFGSLLLTLLSCLVVIQIVSCQSITAINRTESSDSCGTIGCPKVICDLKTQGNSDFCNTVRCNGLKVDDCPGGSVYQEGLLMCGCCPGCARYLKAGDKCSRQPQVPEISQECEGSICPIFTNECPQGMECALVGPDFFTCTVTGGLTGLKCPNKLALAEEGQLHWTPSCEPDGSYSPKQCKGKFSSGICFCVNEEGERIFGREKWAEAENMTCACSRQAYRLRQEGLVSTLHCTEDGNYEALQCDTDSRLCYCVDTATGKTTGAVFPEHQWKSLPCFSMNITNFNPDGEYLRRCESDWASVQKVAAEAKLHGLNVLSGRTVTCDYDGSFAPVQNIDGRKNCVGKDNFLIGNNFQTEVNAKPTNCQCVRDEIYADQDSQPFLLDCVVPTGNYAEISPVSAVAPIQYRCVDSDGFFFGDSAPERSKCCLLLGTTPTACKDQSSAVKDMCYDPRADDADNQNKIHPCTYWPV